MIRVRLTMASRKPKQIKSLARPGATRAPYAKVLIVCEGKKTEPNYFNELKQHYKIPSANIVITGDCRSDPLSIVNHAKKLYAEQQDLGDAFDQIYCDFDRDTHSNYADAVRAIDAVKRRAPFHAIRSVPCFEYWLLLHYHYTTKPYYETDKKSPCEQVLADLRANYHGYKKGSTGTFGHLLSRLEEAKVNAAQSLKAATAQGTANPSTQIQELVAFLQTIHD